MSNNRTIYTVFKRLRSKHLDMILPQSEVCMHDNIEIVFQSFSLEKAKKYFDAIDKIENEFWFSISKSLIITPLDRDEIDGFYNGNTIVNYNFN